MTDSELPPRWNQFSLWSLLVLTTFVAVLCAIGVSTNWIDRVAIIVGTMISWVGFHGLSSRKHPSEGLAFAVAGFVVRLTGLALIAYGLLPVMAKVAARLKAAGVF
jgi:hypothetical protein